MENEQTVEMIIGKGAQVLSKEQSEIVLRINKVLQIFKGKQVLVNASGGIITNQIYKDFDYKFFQNCEKETLLDFQDEGNEENPTACIKIDDICHTSISDNVGSIKIELKDEFTIRLELKG